MTLIDKMAAAIKPLADENRDHSAAEEALKIVREHDKAKLNSLKLHDDTGDPQDVGYMHCLGDVAGALGVEL